MVPSAAQSRRERVAEVLPGVVEDLKRFVAIPSVSGEGVPPEPLFTAHDFVVEQLRAVGVDDVEELVIEGKVAPVVVGRIPAPPGAPTVLLYTHYDVVPAGDEDLWDTPPFEAVERDGAIYGRGTADSKANLLGVIGALRVHDGRPPVGITLIFEGQEEVGSPFDHYPPSAPEIFHSDAMVIADVGSVRPGDPTLTIALRGSAQVDVEVRTLAGDKHSGVFGGAAPDARLALIQALATLHDEHGDVAVEGLRRDPWSGGTYTDDEFRELAEVEEAAPLMGTGDLGSRIWTGPAITVVALDAPGTDAPINAVAGHARASLNLRVHPQQDPAEAQAALVDHLRALSPFGVELQVTAGEVGPGFAAGTDGTAFAAATAALEESWGRPAITMAGGGSIPLVMALHEAVPEAEILLFGVTDSYANIHAPNERVLVDELEKGILAKALLFDELAEEVDPLSGTGESEVAADEAEAPAKKGFTFPSAVTILVIVLVLMWVVTIFLPSGQYQLDEDGAPIAGSYEQIDSPLSFGEQVTQLVRAPINGTYGVQGAEGFVDTELPGFLFGSVGVVVFIFSLGIFISVSFATRSLEVAVAQLAGKLKSRGWLLIVAIMVLFSLLGSTMGFSVETFGFYALFLPLMAALGYDRMTTAGMVILGASTGAMASTVNPFSIGVASGEAGTSIGDGIALRLVLWVVLTAMSTAWVVRYAQQVRADPSRSIVKDDPIDDEDEVDEAVDAEQSGEAALEGPLTGVQKIVLVITAATFGLLIFSVIPWSSILGATTSAAEYDTVHQTATEPYWWELGWWFPQLSMLFVLSAVLIGIVARMGEKRLVGLMTAGVGDMVGPAIVIVLARGVAVLLNNTQTLDTVLNSMETLVDGSSSGVFAVLVALVNMPLAFLIPSSSGHATLAMPLLAPLSDFAGVSRPLTITAYQMGHGLMLLIAPTNVVIVGGLAIAKVGYNRYVKLVAPLFAAMAVVITVILVVAASLD